MISDLQCLQPVRNQNQALSGSSATLTAGTGVQVVRISTTDDCTMAIGATAAAGDMPIKAAAGPEYFKIPVAGQVSFFGASGTVSMTDMS